MSRASKYSALSSLAMDSSSAQICWALVSFGVIVVSAGLSVVVSLALAWLLLVFLGQLCATWPCSWHQKHLPSFANLVRSSGVSFLKLVVVVASTSMGTMLGLGLLCAVPRCWLVL